MWESFRCKMLTQGQVFSHGGGRGAEDSQAPSLSSSSSTWSLRDSILSPRPQSSATCSGLSSSGGTGSTARTQAPACVAHYKGKRYLRTRHGPKNTGTHASPSRSPAPASPDAHGGLQSPSSGHAPHHLPPELGQRRMQGWRPRLHGPGPPHQCPTPTRHTEDAGTCRGLGRLPCTGASVGTQHQGVRTATREAAQCVETAMRAEGKAGPAFIHI